MDSRIGLDYIVENREYVSKLGAALDTSNVIVKKQVFELLSALCAYNADGYARAIETLEFYKKHKNERYRLKVVINELEKATNAEYQVALLAFINCVIISASSLQERIRIRNEFIGLKVLPLLTNLRKAAQGVGDIIVQLDVFDEQRECDEAQSLQGPSGINLNSHLDVFYAILRQVADTPQEVPFLSILQHLLRIDPKEAVSDVIWDTTEKLVHHATLLETDEESERFLRCSLQKKFTCSHCRGNGGSDAATSPNRRTSTAPNNNNNSNNNTVSIGVSPTASVPPAPSTGTGAHTVSITISGTTTTAAAAAAAASASAPPPPPPPPSMQAVPPPPPPPLAFNGQSTSVVPPAPPPPMSATRPPPPVPPPPVVPSNLLSHHNGINGQSATSRSITPDCQQSVLLPQQDTPAPKSKMRTINWGKIPANKVLGKQNIWTIVANNQQHSPIADIDWNEMEGLFCLQSTSTQGSPKLGRGDSGSSSGYDTLDRKSKKESTEITLLDGKRSLNVNIFLKQFRTSNGDIIQLIRNGDHTEIGAEKLRGLLKILPEIDELDMLKSFNGDKTRLGNAEKFLLRLMEIPNYKLRIESMLLKEEFSANIGYLEPCINAIIYAGDDLINNKMLQDVLYMVVVAGNFLNCGGYAGNAVGVKLASLQKLTDIRANKPGMNLIHFVAMQAEKRNPELLKFTTQLGALENATKTTSEQINNEINTLDGRIRKIKRQIEQPTTEEEIKVQMLQFLKTAEREVAVLQAGMKEVDAMRLKLAEFFCEDPDTFRLEECFKIFQTFTDRFRHAVKENAKRQQLEEQAILRRKQREEQLAKRARQMNLCGTPGSDSENPNQLLLDNNFDPRASPALSRRRMGSFNSGVDINTAFMRVESNDSSMSPDITPNGSLRRRRSRVLPEEDELMEFLRSSSGQEHISRDRKAYGSLDRSWARRARSGSSSRRRPELLNIDFGEDRERANSPVPIVQRPNDQQSPMTPNGVSMTESLPTTASFKSNSQPITGDNAKPRISREWRQKIETWLQSNENDEKQNEEYKWRRRVANSNRRSLENDTDSERKLDTLPEEKTVPSTPVPIANHSNHNTINNTNQPYTSLGSSCGERENYKRVYPDWKPSQTLEHTDVVATIQAIANVNATARNQYQSNSTSRGTPETNSRQLTTSDNNRDAVGHLTTAEELREYRRQRSLEQAAEKHSSPLHSIAEEDRRKPYTPTYVRHLSRREENSSVDEKPVDRLTAVTLPRIEYKSPTPPTTIDMSITSGKQSATATTPPNNTSQNKVQNGDNDSDVGGRMARNGDDTFAQLLSHHKSHNEKYSPKEIDADNIETPPVTRRVFSGPNGTIVSVSNNINGANNTAGDNSHLDQANREDESSLESSNGQPEPSNFDRYSATRRTRRYKRPTDYSSGNEEVTTPSSPSPIATATTAAPTNATTHAKDNTWVEQRSVSSSSIGRGKEKESIVTPTTPTMRKPLSERTITKLEKVGRHISSINQEDVQEAIRNLKSPTGTPERIWSPPRDILRPTGGGNGASTSILLKASNHELNDEGFEETQSLVSDTPSHGKESTTSSCNEAGNEMPKRKLMSSSHKSSATTTSNKSQNSSKSQTSASTGKLSDRLQLARLRLPSSTQQQQQQQLHQQSQRAPTSVILPRRNVQMPLSNMERSRSMRMSNPATCAAGTSPIMASTAVVQHINNGIRRGNSMRKPMSSNDISAMSSNVSGGLTFANGGSNSSRRDVERSSSRNSLRSSRSSINSSASTNTVRRMPVVMNGSKMHQQQPLQTVSVESSPSKRPLTVRNTSANATGSLYRSGGSNGGSGGVPASRSSSSGSSVGQNIVVIRRSPTALANPAATIAGHRDRGSGGGNTFSSLGTSTSFKENAAGSGTRAQAARQAVLVKATASTTPAVQRNNSRSSSSTRASSLSGFMRPTTASVTKRSK